ncbi:hypothetical protein P1X15_13200 [Runella sp. MFBS21]|uniref:hypothetical protein n=1 Tax=Runella sp. MFBS21 TaxID=3034018 RepID=UPI0023F84170|nr:hypothetical protein [Runella sp. MFBS21]MDF7818565.1 hypothetical protein [Runella sp. MFBS21]
MKLYSTCCLISILLLCIGRTLQAQNLEKIKKQKPFEVHGSLSLSLQFYDVNGISSRRPPFTWYITGAPVVKIWGMSLPISLTLSEQQRTFSQPFNQWGASPYFKKIKFHLGYRNVRFSDFTLGGATFLGVGVESIGTIRFGFVYGQFVKPIEEDSSGLDPRYRYLRPSYRRLGMAGKIGVGKPNAFLDISVFKAHDVIGSINTPSKRSQVTPMENLAVGIKNHLSFFKQKLVVDLDVGASLLTRNTLRYDYEGSDPVLRFFVNILPVNGSTSLFTAARGNASYRFKSGSLAVQYQRIDPDYQSLGAYYFQNDVEQFTLSPSFSFFKNKLMINGSYGRSHDNLNQKKLATTYRNVGAVNISAALIPRLNITLMYTNFGVGQSRGLGDLFNDSLAISIVNASYSGNISYSLGSRIQRQTFGVMATYQNTNDQNQFTRQYVGASSFISSVSYSYSYIPAKLTSSLSVSYVSIETYGRRSTNIGPALTASKEWWKGKLRTSFTHNSQLRQTNRLSDGIMANTGMSASIHQKKQSLTLAANYLYNRYNTSSEGINYRNFSEYRGTITYGIRF